MKNHFKLLTFSVLFFFLTNLFADFKFIGTHEPIPENIRKQMIGTTWKKSCPVSLDQLSYVRVSYWGFDNKPHVGELILNKVVAESAIDVFKQIYQIRFPIESMKLRSCYFKHPNDSSKKDNSSAFNYRKDDQTPTQLSLHSYGIAIDINPFYNPAPVAGGKVDPEGAAKYLNRNIDHKGMIKQNSQVFHIMTKHGWAWGQYFKKGADPMHFEKIVTRQYIIKSYEYFPNSWGLNDAM